MNNLRQNFQHAQWGSIVGNEKGIRLAVLKDEIEVKKAQIKQKMNPAKKGEKPTPITPGQIKRREGDLKKLEAELAELEGEKKEATV